MNQRKKNIKLIIVLSVLVCLTLLVYFIDLEPNDEFEKKKFTLDQNTVITSVYISGNGIDNKLEYVGGQWEINSRFIIDNGMRDVFFAVLSQVEIRRPVPSAQKDSIATSLHANGLKVTILNNGEIIRVYYVGGDEDQFVTYFMMEGEEEVYIMQIPGYLSYIAGIYHVPENDWRDRYIWPVDWSRLKTMRLEFYENTGAVLEFEYLDNFISIVGVEPMDTASVMNYLQNIAELQANTFLEPGSKYSQFAIEENRFVQIKIEQIANDNYNLDIYRIPGNTNFYLGVLNTSQEALFHRRNIDDLQKTKAYFLPKE